MKKISRCIIQINFEKLFKLIKRFLLIKILFDIKINCVCGRERGRERVRERERERGGERERVDPLKINRVIVLANLQKRFELRYIKKFNLFLYLFSRCKDGFRSEIVLTEKFDC